MKSQIFFVAVLLSFSAVADCIFEGQPYQVYEYINVVDAEFKDNPRYDDAEGISLALVCLPIVDVNAVESGDFKMDIIPIKEDAWVPSPMVYHFDKPKLIYSRE